MPKIKFILLTGNETTFLRGGSQTLRAILLLHLFGEAYKSRGSVGITHTHPADPALPEGAQPHPLPPGAGSAPQAYSSGTHFTGH
jgi:hypothetical protein